MCHLMLPEHVPGVMGTHSTPSDFKKYFFHLHRQIPQQKMLISYIIPSHEISGVLASITDWHPSWCHLHTDPHLASPCHNLISTKCTASPSVFSWHFHRVFVKWTGLISNPLAWEVVKLWPKKCILKMCGSTYYIGRYNLDLDSI